MLRTEHGLIEVHRYADPYLYLFDGQPSRLYRLIVVAMPREVNPHGTTLALSPDEVRKLIALLQEALGEQDAL